MTNWRTKQLNSYATSKHHAWIAINLKKKKWCLFENCQTFAHKLFKNAYFWLVLADLIFYDPLNKFARAVTHWTKACDKRSTRLISYIHHTSEFRQYWYVGNTAQQCRSGLFQDSDFAGDLEDSISTSGGLLCIFGSHAFVPISRMFNKQSSVSHSSVESVVISSALELWDLVFEVLHSSTNQPRALGNRLHDQSSVRNIPAQELAGQMLIMSCQTKTFSRAAVRQ